MEITMLADDTIRLLSNCHPRQITLVKSMRLAE
jgi:hypothetical protein